MKKRLIYQVYVGGKKLKLYDYCIESVKKYCEQTKKDANRRGLTLTNFLSLSILENLKSKVK